MTITSVRRHVRVGQRSRRAFRPRSGAPVRRPVAWRAPADPQRRRRRRPAAGRTAARVRGLSHIPGGHQPQGVALPDSLQPVGQHVPLQAEPPVGGLGRRDHGARPGRQRCATAAGLRSAEAEVLDALPDNEIKAAMDALPEGFRTAVYYADVQGYTYAETACILNIPPGTVMSRASRGRQRLRIALAHLDRGRGLAAAEQRIA